jgi:multisubunit Na+/H+ antiporter MnhB subunit
MIELYLLLALMILGAIIALEAKDLISATISLGIVGFGLVLVFLILQAPDLAIVQIVVETLSLIILIAAILKTTRQDTAEAYGGRKVLLWGGGLLFLIIFMLLVNQVIKFLPQFGSPVMRMSQNYLDLVLSKTGAANLVASVILDFRGYDTLGEATVLFTAVIGVVVVLRKIGRKGEKGKV